MTEIVDAGIYVDILGTKIRAMNIQVTGYPTVIDGESYPLYFEIPFKSGKLWVVEKADGPIQISVFSNFKADPEAPADLRLQANDWQLFLDFYKLSVLEE